MKVILFNPAHNGDILFSSGIVGHIVKSNPDTKFILIPSCSSVLYKQYIGNNVEVDKYVFQWNITKSEINNNYPYNELLNLTTTLWHYMNDTIYINMWQFMINKFDDISVNRACFMNLYNRHIHIKILFNTIYKSTGHKLVFNCDNYKDLIPIVPKMDITFFKDAIKEKVYDNIILFYNFHGYSGQESIFKNDFNEYFIIKLLLDNPNSLLILPNSCSIKHTQILNLEDDLNIKKEQDGSSIVMYANICEICDKVYFKNNGGSLFQLNQRNIENKKTLYYLIDTPDTTSDGCYEIFKNVYGLNCEFIDVNTV
jgi:hypothetical protein